MEGGTGFEPVNGDFADHSVSLFATRPYTLRVKIIIPTLFWIGKKKQSVTIMQRFFCYGAEDEIRTRDPRLGKAMLYH